MLKGNKIFDYINVVILTIVGLLVLMPFIHVLAKSISSGTAVSAGKVGFLPIGFDLSAYEYVLFSSGFLNALIVSIIVTVLGTIIGMIMTIMAAYPLSKPDFKGRKFIVLLYVFAMLFYGGIIPGYVLMKALNLLDTVWAMIIPYLVIPFNLLLIKTFFEGIPEGMEEAAKMDGASQFRILISIVLPISLPVIATTGLFTLVTYWNNFFHPLIFISDPQLKPLPLYLYEMITSTGDAISQMSVEEAMSLTVEGVRAAIIIVTVFPVLIVYPFVQKHLIAGLTLGSDKG